MRSIAQRVKLVAVACLTAAGGCSGDDDDLILPPEDEIFIMEMAEVDSNHDGFINEQDDVDNDLMIDTELRYYFDDRKFLKYCVTPDADSFDDYETVNPNTGRIEIPRGTTPISAACEADGIATGPLHDELFPSKWCKRTDCSPAADK